MLSVTNQIRGRTVSHVLVDGERMTLCMTNGQEFRFIWADEEGERIEGEPKLEGIDAKVVLKV